MTARRRLAVTVLVLCTALIGLGGGIAAHDLARPSTGHTAPNAGTYDGHPSPCPPGQVHQVVGQWSPRGSLPILLTGCGFPPTYYGG